MSTPKQMRVEQPTDEETDDNRSTISKLAREMLFACDGNAEKANERGLSRLRNEPKLLRLVMESAIQDAMAAGVQNGIRKERASIIHRVTRDRVVALAEGMLPCLLDIPLAGGKKLRDASRTEVLEQVNRYETQAGNMMHKARWLRLVAQSVPDDKSVGDVLPESRVKELYQEAQHADHKDD